MSKSTGEFLGMEALRKRGYDPIVYRYFVVLGHFQSQLAFSWDAMDAAANGYKNIVRRVADIIANKSGDTDDVSHDGAIVYSDGADYVLVIMCDYPQNASLQGHRFIELSKMAYEYFNK